MPYLPKTNRATIRKRSKVRKARATGDQSFYNSTAWRKASRAYRLLNPLCAVCLHLGEVTACDVTDHAIPISEDGARMDQRNWLGLCHRCHNRKSGMEAHGLRRRIAVRRVEGGYAPFDMDDVIKLVAGGGGIESLAIDR